MPPRCQRSPWVLHKSFVAVNCQAVCQDALEYLCRQQISYLAHRQGGWGVDVSRWGRGEMSVEGFTESVWEESAVAEGVHSLQVESSLVKEVDMLTYVRANVDLGQAGRLILSRYMPRSANLKWYLRAGQVRLKSAKLVTIVEPGHLFKLRAIMRRRSPPSRSCRSPVSHQESRTAAPAAVLSPRRPPNAVPPPSRVHALSPPPSVAYQRSPVCNVGKLRA